MKPLSRDNFIEHLTKSSTATKLGINNEIPVNLMCNAKLLYSHYLLITEKLGFPDIYITSGYRCPKLNKAVGGVPGSKHCRCLAFDFAFPNSTVSKSTLNDLTTIIDAIHADKLNHCDGIFSTLGMWISQERMQCKAAEDFFDKVHLLPTKNNKSYNWMHGLFHRNFKKFYGQEYYIDKRCDTKRGTADDVYFSRTLQRFTNCYVAPTVIINKPSSQASCTWANEKGTYEYPPTLFDKIDEYILETADKEKHHHVNPYEVRHEIILDRNDYLRDQIKPYVPRGKKSKATEIATKVQLF